jgi:hypothetical protein
MRCYSGNVVAMSVAMYWWLLIFINRMIIKLNRAHQLCEENAQIAADLCKSHGYAMQQAPFGSFFNMASISLRIAYPEIRDEAKKVWLWKAVKEIHAQLRLGDPEKNRITSESSIVPGIFYPLDGESY